MLFITKLSCLSHRKCAVYVDWPCDVNLQEAPGQIASPRWPEHYPDSTRCTWRLTAPVGQRIRVNFTDFNLDRHVLGHCNDLVDHVRLFDGGSTSAPQIGVYCGRALGTQRALVVLSTSRDLIVQFQSIRRLANRSLLVGNVTTVAGRNVSQPSGDGDRLRRQGFHIVFNFEPTNATVFDDNVGLIDW